MLSSVNLALVHAHGGGRVVSYAEVPDTYALAIAQYCAIDGEGWDRPQALAEFLDKSHKPIPADEWQEELCKHLPLWRAQKRAVMVGMIEIPTPALCAAVMERSGDVGRDWERDFDAYHKWYTHSFMPDYDVSKPLWPSLLSCRDDEVFEDGWHRFHDYVRKGVKLIPCAWFHGMEPAQPSEVRREDEV